MSADFCFWDAIFEEVREGERGSRGEFGDVAVEEAADDNGSEEVGNAGDNVDFGELDNDKDECDA